LTKKFGHYPSYLQLKSQGHKAKAKKVFFLKTKKYKKGSGTKAKHDIKEPGFF
jgi:hypothetical protein